MKHNTHTHTNEALSIHPTRHHIYMPSTVSLSKNKIKKLTQTHRQCVMTRQVIIETCFVTRTHTLDTPTNIRLFALQLQYKSNVIFKLIFSWCETVSSGKTKQKSYATFFIVFVVNIFIFISCWSPCDSSLLIGEFLCCFFVWSDFVSTSKRVQVDEAVTMAKLIGKNRNCVQSNNESCWVWERKDSSGRQFRVQFMSVDSTHKDQYEKF